MILARGGFDKKEDEVAQMSDLMGCDGVFWEKEGFDEEKKRRGGKFIIVLYFHFLWSEVVKEGGKYDLAIHFW